ncbi:MAG: hypothetical protein GWN93_03380 [Deltaproteobacteria bacterium]|nr:hypothetical protein [Deltaproteobacteria bacterium]
MKKISIEKEARRGKTTEERGQKALGTVEIEDFRLEIVDLKLRIGDFEIDEVLDSLSFFPDT